MIYGKVGRLGHGKTMRAVVHARTLQAIRSRGGRECWLASNVQLRGVGGVRFVHLPMDGFSEGLGELMGEARARGAGLVVLVDEVDEVWGATDWQLMRKGDRHRIKQSRHYGTDLIWTAQFVDQVEKSIRNITEEVELMRAYPAPTLARREAGKRPWFMRAQRFRPAAVRETMGDPDKDHRLGNAWFRYRREWEDLYDTDELIEPVNAERLCARHEKEARESRCPVCHPVSQAEPLGFAEFVAAASEEPAA